MEWYGMEWNETEWNGMEGKGKEWCVWNGMKSFAQTDARSSQIGTPLPPKSALEVPRGIQIRFREHFEQQVGLPWPVWAAIGTLRAPILTLLGFILELPGIILMPWGKVLGAPSVHFESPGAPHGHFFLIWQRFC